MAMFREIMTLAQRDDERRLALDILKQIRTTESLSVAVAYLQQPNLSERRLALRSLCQARWWIHRTPTQSPRPCSRWFKRRKTPM